ncbi:hypothetical protein N658DRAFT_458804 [Parathielavia hyrcaniae]|uniref:Uncharacterized protein n=1 Tax=Parathielavia hyrcaniae TaxID=113614 RepID=A0AAN6SX85_9PEZI|nr:hypothetical protein N658DRAFT_458804 [Parathielavia hyrcaniae]
MHTVLDIIHATDRVSRHIADAQAGRVSGSSLSPEELADSIIAKNRAKPYLKNYSAMLNSVPIVGLKGDNVMYTETRSGGLRGVEDVWAVFGPIPPGVNIDSTKAVHFFPYKGDFCMSVGTAIWRKRHRDEKDPELKRAVDNWPKLYLDAWEKVGDNCLPTSKARNVIPFARLAGKDIRFHLVVLAEDGQLLALNGDLQGSGNTFSELKNASDAKNAAALALKVQQAAYFNGNIVAVDEASHTWNLDVDFDANKFVAKDQRRIEPLVELTATDIGPVGVRQNGWIYRRRLQTVADPDGQGEAGDDKLGWDKWIKQDGVTHLGVASPGVMLDLMSLTYSLNERYLSTQSLIYPVVNKLLGYATYQEMFLRAQLAASEQYKACENDQVKQDMAVKEGKKLVRSTKMWAITMQKAAVYVHGSVGGMSDQLSSVKIQLDQQLVILNDKLVSLEAQIKALQDAKSKMDAAFWGAIGAMVLGIGLAIIGACTGFGVIALGLVGGGLFVGGLVAACYFGSKSQELANQISGLEAEARDVTTAIRDISFIAEKFGDINAMYNNLNQYWGRMANASENLKDMNNTTALQLGMGFLDDQISIVASMNIIRDIKKGCATYLAVMNRSGIVIPNPDDDDDEDEAGDIIVSDNMDPIKVDPTFRTVGIWNEQVRRATQALEQGRFAEAEKHMAAADLIDFYTMDMGILPKVVIDAVGAAHQQETTEAADIFDGLAKVARCTPLGFAVSYLSRDVEVVIDAVSAAHQQETGEAADIFDGLAKVARCTPLGFAVSYLSRDVEVVSNEEAADVETNNTTAQEPREAADIFGDLASVARLIPARMAIGRDMDVVLPANATATLESADLFGVIADFSRFTPVKALLDAGMDAARVVVPELSPLLSALPAMRGAADVFAIAAPFPPNHPSSGMLNGILGQARTHVCTMLNKTSELTVEAEVWLNLMGPDVSMSSPEALYNRGKALLACKQAMEHARLANNAFVDFNHQATEEGIRIQREMTEKQDRIAAIEARCRAEIEQALRPQVLDLFTLGLSRIDAEIRAREIRDTTTCEIAYLHKEIAQLATTLHCGQTYRKKATTWTELCQQASAKLGGIYNILSSVRDGIKVDAQAYQELAAMQWDQIRRDVAEVHRTLQPQSSQDMVMVAMDLDLRDGAADLVRASRNDAALLQVARPAPALLEQLRSQAGNSETVWNNIGTLERLTYTEDIVGYFDAVTNRKVTLKDVIGTVKTAYVQTAVMHYETIEHISSLALMQKMRAASLADGKVSPHVFLRGTALSISMARKQADRVKSLMGEVSPGLTHKLTLVRVSIEELDRAIAAANLDLARRDKAYRDKVTGVLVEGCLKGFATGGLVAAAGFAAYSGVAMASIPAVIAAAGVIFAGKDDKNKGVSNAGDNPKTNGASGVNGKHGAEPEDEEEAENGEEEQEESEAKDPAGKDGQNKKKDIPVKQRVQAAQETWTTLSGVMQSARTAAAGTTLGKALFNKLSLGELATLVQLVKTAVVVMERTAAAVERLSSPLEELLVGVGRVAHILDDMDARCTAQSRLQVSGEDVVFGVKDAAEMRAQWDDVAAACTLWLDIFNAQRISPITYSVA